MHESEAWERYEAARREAEGAPTLSAAATRRRQALREAQAEDCAAGYHEDPDNSGFCIRCGAAK
jgi:hypothetical protein